MKKKNRQNHKILIASGVNLDLLGQRQQGIYGAETLDDMKDLLASKFKQWCKKNDCKEYKLIFFQTNDEAKFLSKISAGFAGAVINAGAWTHTSLALADRLVGLRLPYVEIHVSKMSTRESFRQHSYLSPHALRSVDGLGISGYWVALEILLNHLEPKV
jgi:3-dehydroquinate dehydratase-2